VWIMFRTSYLLINCIWLPKGFVLVLDNESVGVFVSKDDVLVDKSFIQLKRKMGNKLWTMEQLLEPVITSQNLKIDLRRTRGRLTLYIQAWFSQKILLCFDPNSQPCNLDTEVYSLPVLKILFPHKLKEVTKLPL
jgi:hypothetical protein